MFAFRRFQSRFCFSLGQFNSRENNTPFYITVRIGLLCKQPKCKTPYPFDGENYRASRFVRFMQRRALKLFTCKHVACSFMTFVQKLYAICSGASKKVNDPEQTLLIVLPTHQLLRRKKLFLILALEMSCFKYPDT